MRPLIRLATVAGLFALVSTFSAYAAQPTVTLAVSPATGAGSTGFQVH